MSTSRLEPRNPQYAQRVHESFALQGIMQTLGARLGLVAPGSVDIALDWAPGLTQQHGFLHAGVVSAAASVPCVSLSSTAWFRAAMAVGICATVMMPCGATALPMMLSSCSPVACSMTVSAVAWDLKR